MNWKNVNLLISALIISEALSNVASLKENETNLQILKPIFVNRPIWKVEFKEKILNMTIKDKRSIQITVTGVDASWGDDFELHVLTNDNSLLKINNIQYEKNITLGNRAWSGSFNVEALFLGRTDIYIELKRMNLVAERSKESMDVIILRKEDIWDHIFVGVVGTFAMLLYINFGAALELEALKDIVLRPIGPAIGLIGQFLVMPVLGYIIGYFLFKDMIELRLGLFFTGSAPAGGASNIFTVILNGNLNLSITMTAISNLAAFLMMPFWIFTLGSLIFHDGNIPIPYKKIAMMSCSLVLPLAVGIALQKFYPKLAGKMAKLLKPVSLVLIIAITIFACTINSYMFRLFSWKIIIGSCALPWFGYIIGWSMASLLGQSQKDALTIAIETGIQNSGIAIFMLLVTLPQPQADMTSAVPVATSMMTPIPLLGLYLIKKIFCRTSIEEIEDAPNKEAKVIEIEQIVTKGQTNPAATIDTE